MNDLQILIKDWLGRLYEEDLLANNLDSLLRPWVSRLHISNTKQAYEWILMVLQL